MTILIVEDDVNKRAQIVAFVAQMMEGASILQRGAYQSGLAEALKSKPELVLLDMSMPTYEGEGASQGGRMRPYGGRELLIELTRRRHRTKVIIITQFETFSDNGEKMSLDKLEKQLEETCPVNYVGAVYYNPAEAKWRTELRALLSQAFAELGEE